MMALEEGFQVIEAPHVALVHGGGEMTRVDLPQHVVGGALEALEERDGLVVLPDDQAVTKGKAARA
ncbi:hypothetical protein D3C86_935950 [compost metagenome]